MVHPVPFFVLREFSFAFSSGVFGHLGIKTREILEPVLAVVLRPQIDPHHASRLAHV